MRKCAAFLILLCACTAWAQQSFVDQMTALAADITKLAQERQAIEDKLPPKAKPKGHYDADADVWYKYRAETERQFWKGNCTQCGNRLRAIADNLPSSVPAQDAAALKNLFSGETHFSEAAILKSTAALLTKISKEIPPQ